MYLVPEQNEKNLCGEYPFTASFMLQVFSRGQKRDNHETLDNSDPIKMVEI